MSVTMSKVDGVTVLTLTSDPQSLCPPLCQILKSLCWNPDCCSLYPQLGRSQRAQSALGTLQIMTGILSIGLAIVLDNSYGSYMFMDHAPCFWMSILCIILGGLCLVIDKISRPCLVIVSVMMHLAGFSLAIAFGCIMYTSIGQGNTGGDNLCSWGDDEHNWYRRRYMTTTPNPSAEGRKFFRENCLENAAISRMLLIGIDAVLVSLVVLEVCVVISVVVLQIKALVSRGTPQKSPADSEVDTNDAEEVLMAPTA